MPEKTEFRYAAPVLASLDLARTIAFYEERLGFRRDFVYDDYASVSRDGVSIHFWLCDDPHIPKQTSCYIYVRDIEPLYAEYQAAKVIHPNAPLEKKSWGMYEFSALDVDGNLLRFGESLAAGQ